jgi:hypothetical protein
MARSSEPVGRFWTLVWILAASGLLGAQAIELKRWSPSEEEAPREGILSPADKTLLGDLPLKRYILVHRQFEGQAVAVEIFNFGNANHAADPAGDSAAFSFFTFLQQDGAKPYADQADCFVQNSELIFRQGAKVVRSVFPDLRRAKLSVYLPWLREQYKGKAPIPELYLKLPSENRIWSGRRFLVRDYQVRLLWPDLPPGLFTLDRDPRMEAGPKLYVARYRDAGAEYWAGWLVGAARPDAQAPDFSKLDGFRADGSGQAVLHLRRCDGAFSLYLGPERAGIGELLDLFGKRFRGRMVGDEFDPGRFFRRDEYSYGDILINGFKIVFLVLAAAVTLGVLAALAIRGAKKAFRRKLDLEDETVVHLHLDELRTDGKKPETSTGESGYNSRKGGPHGGT